MKRVLMGFCAVFVGFHAGASTDFDWAGAAEAGGGIITISDGQTVSVCDDDILAFANITKITCEGTTSRILFTNTVPFIINAEINGPGGGTENVNPMIEMTADTGKITFSKKCTTSSNGRLFVVGNVDVLSGAEFGPYRGNGTYGYIKLLAGCTLDFKDGSKLKREYMNYLYGDGTYKFACKIPTGSSAANRIYVSEGGTFVMNGDNLFNVDSAVGFLGGGSSANLFTLDLNGHPQSIPHLEGAIRVTSDTAATLTYAATSTADSSVILYMQGQASLVHASTKKTTITAGTSTTAGTLTISDGTVVLAKDASWQGGAVSVTGGKLTLNGFTSLGSGVDVVVSDTGVIEIPAGVACSAKSLTINGDVIDISTPVSLETLAATYPENVSGTGYIGNSITRYISPTGSNSADGKTEAKAWKTFEFACAQIFPGGSRLIALPGVYNEGEMTKSGVTGACRIVVPDGLTVVSRDGAATTIIEGRKATTSVWNDCGTDSLRCAYVGINSRIEGFTLRGGRAYSDGSTKADGGGVYAYGSGYNPGDSWIVDCIITNCASSATGGASKYGKFLRCRILSCTTPSYSSGIRCGAAYNCYFQGQGNVGDLDSGSGAPTDVACVGNTFVHAGHNAIRSFTGTVTDCLFVGTAAANNGVATRFENCLFSSTSLPSFSSGSTTNGACRVATAAEIALDDFGRPMRASVAVNTGIRADYEAAMPSGEAGTDGSGASRYLFGGLLDVGAYEYDPKADFSAALGDGVTVTAVTDGVVFGSDDAAVAIPAGDSVSLDWTLGQRANTQFTFDAALEEGATLSVYNGTTLIETVTTSKTVSFYSTAAAKLRLVASGTGTAQVANFQHDTTAVIVAEHAGVELTGAEFGINYMTGDPITFTLARKLDSSDYLSSGFTSNGVFYAWEDYPAGWSYTVRDRASAIAVAVIYKDPLNEWYVAQQGGDDDDHYGRLPTDAFATIQKALSLASNGDTVWVNDGTYATGEMGDLSSESGGSRIVVPAGVTVRSVNGRAKTTIQGRAATTPLSCGGCGTDSLRCVELKANAMLIGFTLTGGYSKQDGSTVSNGGAVLATSGSGTIDCTITNCFSSNFGVCYSGNYVGCRIVKCDVGLLTYAKGIRDAALVCNCYLEGLGNGYTSSIAANKILNSTFKFVSGEAIFHNYDTTVRNCRLQSSGSTIFAEDITYARCLSRYGYKDGSTLTDGSTTYTDEAEAREAANEDYLELVPEAFREWARTIDANGNPRIMNGQMDIGGEEYDCRGDFSLVLAADGTFAIETVGPRTVVDSTGAGLALGNGETLTGTWTMPAVDVTTYQFEATLGDESSLTVYTNGVLMTTLTASGKVRFTGTDDVALKLVSAGTVTVRDFRNAAKAIIAAEKAGIAVTGAEIGVNYVGSEPLTFTIRRVYDSYDQYSTGFTSNGVFFAWEDYPNGFTYTVKDIDTAISFIAVYTTEGSLKDWYVSPTGSDTANYGRASENRLKTLAKAAALAQSGDTIHAAAGAYAENAAWCTAGQQQEAVGYYRVILPEGVTLISDEGAEKTFIVGAKAEPEDARIVHGGCGTNSVRGVFLNRNTTLRGFTVTGCYGYCYDNGKGEPTGEYGGGIYSDWRNSTAANVGRIYDCVISNNYAWGGAGAHGGCFVRCQFLDNCSKLGYRVGFTGTPGYAINCVFTGQRTSGETNQGHATDINAAINCSFLGNVTGIRSGGTLVNCYNCIFQGTPATANKNITFRNCRATVLPRELPESWTNYADNAIVSSDQLEVDPVTLAPLANDLATVDSAAAWDHYTNQVMALIAEAEWTKDLNGGQRVYDGRLDIGAVEYDWRGDFSRRLAHTSRVSVTEASVNVQTNAAAVKIPEGTLKVSCTSHAGLPCSFVVRQQGEGTLTVTCGETVLTPVAEVGGVCRYEFPMPADRIELNFTFTGSGYVDLASFKCSGGTMMILK